jgi:serine/threonine protein kinase/Tfp pilus assembly protein PilF
MIGDTILHYRIIEELGRGGMGVVYLAEDTNLSRKVAIKFLPHNISANSEERERFKNEAKAAAALNHPNISTIHSIETSGDEVFIVMEFVDGVELKDKIKSGPIQNDEAVNIGIQIAEGLEAAHKKGIIHRDIKSQNIMITKDGIVKIMDFGLAKMRGETQLTRIGTTIGTAAYISPEQARGEEVDQRTDIWSFGVVLYEMLTGKLPFPGDYEQAVIYSILNEESKVASTVVPGMRRIILKALTKDVNKRYQSADEIIKDLRSLRETPSGKRQITLRPVNLRWIIAALLIIAVVISVYLLTVPHTFKESVKTIAVLPFTDLSPNKGQEYFADGLTEELMNVMAQNPRLRVTSRTSAFSFRGTETPIKTIAEKLNVKYILEGSVSKSGSKIRITAELVNVATDTYMWSDTYDEKWKDVLTLQDTISRSVAEALDVALLGGKIPASETETNPEAYNDYLQGRYFGRQLTKQNLETAIGFYRKALAIDPNYARAWAGLSTTHSNQAGFGYIPMEKGYDEARREAEKALELDPNLGVAYAALGWIKQYYDWDWIGADSAYNKAMKLEPESSGIIGNAAQLLATLGQFNKAIILDHRAIQLDPISTSARFNLGFHAYYTGRFEESIASFRKELELNPHISQTHTYIGLVYLAKGDLNSASEAINKETDPFWHLYGLALINYAMGKKKESDDELNEIIKEDQNDSAFQIAEIYAYRGEKDKAIEWLERAYKQRDSGLAEMKGDPLLRNIEKDPAYVQFLKKMKLPL